MRDNYTQLYIHCVWATWDRLSIITPDIQSAIYSSPKSVVREEEVVRGFPCGKSLTIQIGLLYAEIIRQCQQLKSTPIVVGSVADHVHLLAGIPPTLSISELMKAVKGSSSHFVTHVIRPGEFFKWQGSYGAFSVSPDHLDRIANYIRNQPQHHAQDILTPHWELPPPVRAGGH